MDDRVIATIVVGVAVSVLTATLWGAAPFSFGGPPRGSVEDDASEYRTVVIFRNDDLEPGHRDDLRRTVSRVFLKKEIPLTNAIIPTSDGESIAGEKSFCTELRQQRREHPGLVEYSQHGYFHEPSSEPFYIDKNGSRSKVETEFGGLPYAEQRERIAKGKAILTECLGTPPRSFVPPYGTYDNTTVRALAEENISVISDGRWFTDAYYGKTEPFETDGVLHVQREHAFVQNWETPEFYSQSHLRRHFDTAYENGDLYVHVLHYWTFDSEQRRDKLRSFLGYVKSHDGVLFMTVEQFASAHREGRLTRTENGWRYVPSEDQPGGVYGTGPINDAERQARVEE